MGSSARSDTTAAAVLAEVSAGAHFGSKRRGSHARRGSSASYD
jgi:hypothetical protein